MDTNRKETVSVTICKVIQKAQAAQLIVCIMSHYRIKLNCLNSKGVASLLNYGVSLNKRDYFNTKTIWALF